MVRPLAGSRRLPHVDIYRSERLVARAHLGRRPDLLFIAFDPITDDPSLDREAFAEAFLAAKGYDAVHILSTRSEWYQDSDMPALLDRVRIVARGYARVVTYGSSMGGYAALWSGAQVGASLAIALSPQHVARPEHSFDPRWRSRRRGIAWRFETTGQTMPPIAEAVVVYDDRDVDGHHAARILRDLPHATMVPVRHGGHPVGQVLVETGLLSSLVIDAAHGRLDGATLCSSVKQRRRLSGKYVSVLAHRQPAHRPRCKLRLAQRAAAMMPEEPLFRSYVAVLLECVGKTDDAVAVHAAVSGMVAHCDFEVRRARCLWRAGRTAEARIAIDRARALPLPSLTAIESAAMMYAADGLPAAALAILADHPALSRRPWWGRWLRRLSASWIVQTPGAIWLGCRLARFEIKRDSLLDPHSAPRELKLIDAWE